MTTAEEAAELELLEAVRRSAPEAVAIEALPEGAAGVGRRVDELVDAGLLRRVDAGVVALTEQAELLFELAGLGRRGPEITVTVDVKLEVAVLGIVFDAHPGRLSIAELETAMLGAGDGDAEQDRLAEAVAELRRNDLLRPGDFAEPTRAALELKRLLWDAPTSAAADPVERPSRT